MTEVSERTRDAIVTPAFVRLSHADNQRFQFRAQAGTTGIRAVSRAVELAGDQPTIPGEDGFGFRNTSHFCEPLPAESRADFGERRALGIGKPELTCDVGAENSIFGAQVFALKEQALIDQATHVRQQPCRVVVLHLESRW